MKLLFVVFVQSLNCVRLFEIPWTIAYQASLPFIISWNLLKLMSIESVMQVYMLEVRGSSQRKPPKVCLLQKLEIRNRSEVKSR